MTPASRREWRCFHCDEVFTTTGAARDHFGERPECIPACQIKVGEERGLVMALRKAETKIAKFEDEKIAFLSTLETVVRQRDAALNHFSRSAVVDGSPNPNSAGVPAATTTG